MKLKIWYIWSLVETANRDKEEVLPRWGALDYPEVQAKSWFKEGTEMDLAQLAEYANLALTWIGFGTVVGLIAKALMPGRDPGGAIATVLMGIGGTLIGCAILQYFSTKVEFVKPISVEGCTVGIGGAFVLLVFYKVLGGHWFVEGEQITRRARRRRQRYRRVYDD